MAVESFSYTITVLGAPGDADEGQPKTGATVQLKKAGISYTGTELGTTGNYNWTTLEAGRYELIVNSVSRGEVFGNGAGIVAGLGYEDENFIVSTATTQELKTPAEVLAILDVDLSKYLLLTGGTVAGDLNVTGTLSIDGDDVSDLFAPISGVTGVWSVGGLLTASGGTETPTTKYYTLGSEDVDGSWRLGVDSGNFVIQERISGTWTTKHTVLS